MNRYNLVEDSLGQTGGVLEGNWLEENALKKVT
jgi:hypothetical protein